MRHVASHEGFRYPPRSSYEIGNECDERSPPLPRIRGNSRSNPSRKIVVGRKRIFPRTKEREREREIGTAASRPTIFVRIDTRTE